MIRSMSPSHLMPHESGLLFVGSFQNEIASGNKYVSNKNPSVNVSRH